MAIPCKAPDNKVVAYHGTRASMEKIATEGLRVLSEEEILNLIKKSLTVAKLDYDEWLDREKKETKQGKLTVLSEMKQDYRKVVWVTDNEATAKDYAQRAPELVFQAVRDAYANKKHWRGDNILREASDVAKKAADIIGTTKVCIIDPEKLALGSYVGINRPTKATIPKDAIICCREDP